MAKIMTVKDQVKRAKIVLKALSFHKDPLSCEPLPQGHIVYKAEIRAMLHYFGGCLNVWEALCDKGGGARATVRDREKLACNRDMLADLVRGVDPTTGELLAEDDPIVKPWCRESLSFVLSLADLAAEDGRYKLPRPPFSLAREKWDQVEIANGPIIIGELCRRVNALVDPVAYKLRPCHVNAWLKRRGLLADGQSEPGDHSSAYVPTPSGERLGFHLADGVRERDGVHYTTVGCSAGAQRYLVEHLDQIAAGITDEEEA